jgi:hypothetical protein
MADKKTKIPGPDHPISIDANPSRAVGFAHYLDIAADVPKACRTVSDVFDLR